MNILTKEFTANRFGFRFTISVKELKLVSVIMMTIMMMFLSVKFPLSNLFDADVEGGAGDKNRNDEDQERRSDRAVQSD